MPSKYKSKTKKPQTFQGNYKPLSPYPVCTNCGRNAPVKDPQFSKCYCGGTYQLFSYTESKK